MSTAIWWVRRDHRLTDNQALQSALRQAETVIPVFVLDPALMSAADAADKRVAFMLGSLRRLDADLRLRASRLIVRQGEPQRQLAKLVAESSAGAIFAEEDPWPYGHDRDRRVAEALPLVLTGGLTVHPPGAIRKADGTPYTVFTPFSRRWKSLPLPSEADIQAAPERLPPPPELTSLPIPVEPELPPEVPFPPGEAEALRRLKAFAGGDGSAIHAYAEQRNRLDLEGTSQLSPYLRFGSLSVRQAVAVALAAREAEPRKGVTGQNGKGAEAWLTELIWREFYMAILHDFPGVLEGSFRASLRHIVWSDDQPAFEAWCEGRTGYPAVDAPMRQLVETGWMHNRARMIVASFLTKDLLIDWRWGEKFFMQRLVDGDPAANNGGWQWVAGTGTDAAPYFRIFNPALQGKKHDPLGLHARRWLPELAHVPEGFIHEPWKMPLDVQREARCMIGQDYPAPIIDHARARERALAAYAQARASGRA